MHSLNLLSLSLLVVQAMQPVLVSAAPVSSEKPSNYVELPEGYNLPTWDSPGYENNFIAQLCSNKDIIDEFKPAKDRWKAAVADNCLGYFDIVGQMFPERIFNKDFSYVQAFSRFFNGPENWTCDMKENPCGSGVATCGDGSMDPFSRPIANPAAWMIMNSFSNIYNFYYNWYIALGDAADSFKDLAPSFLETFSPDENDLGNDKILSILIGVVSMGYGLTASMVFNSAKYLSTMQRFNVNKDKAKESTAAIAGSVFVISPSFIKDAEEKGELQNNFKESVTLVVDKWREAIRGAADETLNPRSKERLRGIRTGLRDGMWLAAKKGEDLLDMTNIIKSVFAATMIYDLWKVNGKRYPVIIKTDVGCDDKHPDAPSYDDEFEADDNLYRYMSEDFAKDHKICMDGKAFYLVMYETGTGWSSVTRGSGRFQNSRLAGQQRWAKELPGWEALTSDDKPWGIEAFNLVRSAWNGYKANGMKNGFKMPELKDAQNLDARTAMEKLGFGFGNNLHAAGISRIPICTAKEAIEAIQEGGPYVEKRGPNFPCDTKEQAEKADVVANLVGVLSTSIIPLPGIGNIFSHLTTHSSNGN